MRDGENVTGSRTLSLGPRVPELDKTLFYLHDWKNLLKFSIS